MNNILLRQENPSSIKTMELGSILDRLGIEKTWKSLILTHIKINKKSFFDTIGQSKEFRGASILDKDLLAGLSFSEISILYEFSLAHVDKVSRKKSGQYFTPNDVAQFIADKSDQFPPGVWLDPCSGIGNLTYWLTIKQEDPESFILNNMKLLDRDPLALLIARALMAIFFQDKESNLFELLEGNFFVADLLSDIPLPEHDFVIMNPPYVAAILDNRFISAKSRDLYVYCIEKVAKESKGFISITPQSFTNGVKFKDFRDFLINSFDSMDIYTFDNMPDSIFKGVKFGSTNTNISNSTRACVIVISPTMNTGYRITPLLRWRTVERSEMLTKASSFLTSFNPNSDVFPKIENSLKGLYDDVMCSNQGYKPLSYFLSKVPTAYSVTVPSSPRYFIPAVRRPLSRVSFKRLYFKTQEDADRLYILLNSSMLYWWWRVNDGGMTLSLKTLTTLPVSPELKINTMLVALLEQSEIDNIVYKQNAGKSNENIKHPRDILLKLNDFANPQYAKELLKTHNNSHLT